MGLVLSLFLSCAGLGATGVLSSMSASKASSGTCSSGKCTCGDARYYAIITAVVSFVTLIVAFLIAVFLF
ncbi:MAG TPA: hypothetical protein VLE02_01435 [Nitrosarchaeum sp.]|nr:hypothetical protein [Nitrosarchaeum sp.]